MYANEQIEEQKNNQMILINDDLDFYKTETLGKEIFSLYLKEVCVSWL
jgi:hypothetical protein